MLRDLALGDDGVRGVMALQSYRQILCTTG